MSQGLKGPIPSCINLHFPFGHVYAIKLWLPELRALSDTAPPHMGVGPDPGWGEVCGWVLRWTAGTHTGQGNDCGNATAKVQRRLTLGSAIFTFVPAPTLGPSDGCCVYLIEGGFSQGSTVL